MSVRWVIGFAAFVMVAPLVASGGPAYAVGVVAVAVASAALGAYLEAERFRARFRR
jgi:hypothetical protein